MSPKHQRVHASAEGPDCQDPDTSKQAGFYDFLQLFRVQSPVPLSHMPERITPGVLRPTKNPQAWRPT